MSPTDREAVERSTIVPKSTAGLLGEIARIANDYDLREAIEDIADSFIWRDCIEEAERLARTPPPSEVSEAMVVAAMKAFGETEIVGSSFTRRAMRAALTAALNQPEQET